MTATKQFRRYLSSPLVSAFVICLLLLVARQVAAQVDPTTLLVGTWAHTGWGYDEVIVFYEDGTFTRGAAGTGPIMTGAVRCKGVYRVTQGILVMKVPGNGDVCNTLETYRFRFINRDQLYLKGVGESVMDDTFVRTR
jgi:hypothetical protein